MKTLLLLSCCVLHVLRAYSIGVDTFRVHFALNDSNISKDAKLRIDLLIKGDSLKRGQKLMVLGYADYLGDSAYNANLSAVRAKNVQDYLVASGLEQKDIKICIGKGKVERAGMTGKTGYQPDRKVEIIIERGKPIKRNMWLRRDTTQPAVHLKVNETFRLDIWFENGSSEFIKGMETELDLVYGFMTRNKTLCIQVEGHICCVIGDNPLEDGIDLKGGGPLSHKRAKAVYDYLIARGIKPERVKYRGYAGRYPLIKPEKTEEDRQSNRRVEIRILSL